MAKKNNLKTIRKIPRFDYDWATHTRGEHAVFRAITWDGEHSLVRVGDKCMEAPSIEVPNEAFTETLEYVTYEKGRSSVNMVFKNKEGETFHFFISDFSAALKFMKNGYLTGSFKYVKKGANYGLQMI